MTTDLSNEALDALCECEAGQLSPHVMKSAMIALRDRAERAEANRDAAIARAVRVKPLEWDEYLASNNSRIMAYAVTPLSTYRITQKFFPETFFSIEVVDGVFLSAYTLDAAKAAAQADYERRILAAIEPGPEARHARDLAVARAALEVAASESYRFIANPTKHELDEQLAANMEDLTVGAKKSAEMFADKILALDPVQIVKDMEK